MSTNFESETVVTEFTERVRANQRKRRSELKSHYDFIVCGSGPSGSVVAGRLAENADVSVLLLEAGGSDNVPEVTDPAKWPLNLGSERDWNFQAEPNPNLNGRVIPLSIGKVLGGGSSINVMVWARGHKSDWDFFASEAGDPAWSYESVLNIYRRIEDWRGAPDPKYRGTGGRLFVQPAPNPNPIAPAMVKGARSVGIPTFKNQNGRMMEGAGGASIIDMLVRNGKRQSVFRSYSFPYMDQPNLTVLTEALVTRLTFEGKRATGVEISYDGKTHRVRAGLEVVLSLGAIHTPKVLMQSGIGDGAELHRFGIPVVQHLPGVGQNLQSHPAIGCVWEYSEALPPRNNFSEATFFWKSNSALASPDLQTCQAELPLSSPENTARFGVPGTGWTLAGSIVRPKSRGHIRLTGRNPLDPIQIDENFLSHPDDLKAAMALVELCREIGNSAALRPFTKREVMPGNLRGAELEDFIRDAVMPYWHDTCTAKMGLDAMSVVDGKLKVYGIENLRIADGSIMPRVTTGNTMAPCVVIGERAAEILRAEHKLHTSEIDEGRKSRGDDSDPLSTSANLERAFV
ncbi:MAG TPA: GMC family oxidoreductase N-terminal domain-containing protein [Candidatus Udaeobacter sp.]|nr:GMC family oxidoreductase N-terminal domain-containing protein [Candidatus Udaeobacter sp.]